MEVEASLHRVREDEVPDDRSALQKLFGSRPFSRETCRKDIDGEAMWIFAQTSVTSCIWFHMPAVVIMYGLGTGWDPWALLQGTLVQAVHIPLVVYGWATPNHALVANKPYQALIAVFMAMVFTSMCLEYTIYLPFDNSNSRLIALAHLSTASVAAMCSSSINTLPNDTTTSMRVWYIVKNSLNLLDSNSDQGTAILIISAHWLEWDSWEFYCGWLMMAASLADGAIATIMMVKPLEPLRRLDALSSLLEVPILLIAGAVFITETRLSAGDIVFLVCSCVITVFTVAFKVALCTGLISEEALMQATKRIGAIAVSNARALITTASTVSRVARSRVHPSRDSTEAPRPYSSEFAGVHFPASGR